VTNLEKGRAAVAHASRLAANGDTTEARLYLAAARCALDLEDAAIRSTRVAADAIDAELRRLAGTP
jgi:hypothetical protein